MSRSSREEAMWTKVKKMIRTPKKGNASPFIEGTDEYNNENHGMVNVVDDAMHGRWLCV